MAQRIYMFLTVVCVLLFQAMPAFAKMLDGHMILRASRANICALTFDDGPSQLTGKVLDALKAEGVKATFFVLGSQVLHYPQMLQRMKDDGHEVANHSFDHADLSKLSAEASYTDLQKVNEILGEFGIKPRYFRPPYGKYNKNVVAMAAKLDMDTVLWSTDSRDWNTYPDYGNMPNIFGRPFSPEEMRGIFLFHETKSRTARDIRLIVTILRAVGCAQFVTVSEYFDTMSLPQLLPDSEQLPPRMTARPDITAPFESSVDSDTPVVATLEESKQDSELNEDKSIIYADNATNIVQKSSVDKPDPFFYSSIKHVPADGGAPNVAQRAVPNAVDTVNSVKKDTPSLLRIPLEQTARDNDIPYPFAFVGGKDELL